MIHIHISVQCVVVHPNCCVFKEPEVTFFSPSRRNQPPTKCALTKHKKL